MSDGVSEPPLAPKTECLALPDALSKTFTSVSTDMDHVGHAEEDSPSFFKELLGKYETKKKCEKRINNDFVELLNLTMTANKPKYQ